MFARACSVALVGIVLAASACASAGPEGPPSPPSGNRAAEIRIARDAVEEPAVGIRDATQAVVAVLDDLRSSIDTGTVAARLELLGEALSVPLRDLGAAIDDLAGVQLVGDAPEIASAEAAVDEAVAAARDAREAARDDVTAQRRLLEADQRLAELVATWDQPGSRSQQLERFAETADAAEALADELRGQQDVAACLTGFGRRAEAAAEIAELTRELRGYIDSYQGERFDERREELGDGPLAGDRLREADAAEIECWRSEAPAPTAARVLDEALQRLQRVLTPADLSGAGSTEG